MTERLDRIEAILQRTAEQQERNTATLKGVTDQQERHAEEIDTLLGAVSTNEVAARDLIAEMAKTNAAVTESNQRFENLRQDAIADRQETAQKFNDAVAQMNTDRAENAKRFDDTVTQMDTDRAENAKRFDDTLNRIDAGQEVIQRLLMELLNTNRDATKLRDRVDNLEQAS
jgi:rubrerythrin